MLQFSTGLSGAFSLVNLHHKLVGVECALSLSALAFLFPTCLPFVFRPPALLILLIIFRTNSHFCFLSWAVQNLVQKADFISRIIDIDDWQILHGLFRYLDILGACHTVDFLANYYIVAIRTDFR